MARAETLLKVVLTPLEPAEVIIKNYMLLNSETVETIEKTTANAAAMSKLNEMRDGFIKILDLKVYPFLQEQKNSFVYVLLGR